MLGRHEADLLPCAGGTGSLETDLLGQNSALQQKLVDLDGKQEAIVAQNADLKAKLAQRPGLGKNPIYFLEPILWLCRV
jgi:hypothetical protein